MLKNGLTYFKNLAMWTHIHERVNASTNNNFHLLFDNNGNYTAQKMKFSIKDFFSKCGQIRSFLRFGHIYWRNTSWKTLFFVQCFAIHIMF